MGCGQSDVGSGREDAAGGGGVGSGGVGGDGPRLNLPHLQDLIGKEALQYRPGARLSQVLTTPLNFLVIHRQDDLHEQIAKCQ